jgi:hypothetical protein
MLRCVAVAVRFDGLRRMLMIGADDHDVDDDSTTTSMVWKPPLMVRT